MVDINTPVTNPELVTAIESLQKESSPEAEQTMVDYLRQGHFLVIFEGSLVHTPPDESGSTTIQNGSTIHIPMYAGNDGIPWYFAFTDWDALHRWKNVPDQKTLVIPFSDFPGMVLRADSNCGGIVLNPGTHNLLIDRQRLSFLTGQANSYTVPQRTQVRLGDPQDYPHGLVQAVIPVLKSMRAVKRAWLILMVKEGEKSFLIVVDFKGDRASVSNAIGQAATPHLQPGMFVDIIPFSESFGQNAVKGHQPFYQRKGLFR